MRKLVILLAIAYLAGCKSDTIETQKSIEGSWRLDQIVFTNPQGAARDSVVNYSEGGFIFGEGKADRRNEVSYRLGANKPIFATYVSEAGTVFFNEPCCNVDWDQIYFMPRGSFRIDFSDKDKIVMEGTAYFANKPGKPGRDVVVYLHKGALGGQ